MNDALDAEVAELADALDSGSSARKGVGVRVPPSAPSSYLVITLLPPPERQRAAHHLPLAGLVGIAVPDLWRSGESSAGLLLRGLGTCRPGQPRGPTPAGSEAVNSEASPQRVGASPREFKRHTWKVLAHRQPRNASGPRVPRVVPTTAQRAGPAPHAGDLAADEPAPLLAQHHCDRTAAHTDAGQGTARAEFPLPPPDKPADILSGRRSCCCASGDHPGDN
jgi:hypothetical protein